MSEPNLEKLLRSWTPRRPSARIELELFGEGDQWWLIEKAWPWLVPAVACLVLIFAFGSRIPDQARAESRNSGALFASLALSNIISSSDSAGGGQFVLNKTDLNLGHNVFANFDWTNRGLLPSSNHSLPAMRTNFLRN
jgi:hypothetical protein